MNGIADMGGMQDMGPVQMEKNEPVFHAPWERRAFALWLAIDPDDADWMIQSLPPIDYLRMSYYERRLTVLEKFVIKAGLVTPAEMESGKVMSRPAKQRHVLTVAEVATWNGPQSNVPGADAGAQMKVAARFQTGQRVRARNMNPTGPTHLVRYTRGRIGVIERSGVGGGEKPQHLYSVRFAARELWGEEANPRDSVYVDMWEGYLEPA